MFHRAKQVTNCTDPISANKTNRRCVQRKTQKNEAGLVTPPIKLWSQTHGNQCTLAHDMSNNCNRTDAYASTYDNCPSQTLQCRLWNNTWVLPSGTFRGSTLDNSTPHSYCLATKIGFISADTSFLRLADTSWARNATLMHLVSLHDIKFCVWRVCFM